MELELGASGWLTNEPETSFAISRCSSTEGRRPPTSFRAGASSFASFCDAIFRRPTSLSGAPEASSFASFCDAIFRRPTLFNGAGAASFRDAIFRRTGPSPGPDTGFDYCVGRKTWERNPLHPSLQLCLNSLHPPPRPSSTPSLLPLLPPSLLTELPSPMPRHVYKTPYPCPPV